MKVHIRGLLLPAARPFFSLRRWFFKRNWFAGRIIEATGNVGHIKGYAFDLGSPYIMTFLKGRFLFRNYEKDEIFLVGKHLESHLPVIELGACIGVVSCVTNGILDDPRSHLVVEANPHLVSLLEANRNRNGCGFEILNAALSYGSDTVRFWLDERYFIGGSTSERNGRVPVVVKATTLSDLVSLTGFDAMSLIVDIEGAEIDLVEHELDLLASKVDTLIIEQHPADWGAGTEAIFRMDSQLLSSGFIQVDRRGNTVVYRNSAYHQDVLESAT